MWKPSKGPLSFFVSSIALVACSSNSPTPAQPVDSGVDDVSPADATGDVACDKLPATGASTVLAARTDGSELGARAAITLDRHGAPVFAYLDAPESGLAKLYVVTWDRCTGAFRTPVLVDPAVDRKPPPPAHLLSIATDPSDGRIGIAYRKIVHLVSPPRVNDSVATFVAVSTDDGASFTTGRISKHKAETDVDTEGDSNDISDPQIAMAGGKSYVAYNQTLVACGATGCLDGTTFATGSGSTWTYEVVSDGSAGHGGSATTRDFPIGLAVDSAGVPALVVHIGGTGDNTVLAMWRPGKTTVATVTDSAGHQNDDGEASLAFDGLKPRVVSRLQRGPIGSVTDYDLIFSASEDGLTWSAPKPLPREEHIPWSAQMVIANGRIAVAAGGPNLFTSSDGTTWKSDTLGLAQGSDRVTLAADGGGKLWVSLVGVTPVSESLGGLVLYREP